MSTTQVPKIARWRRPTLHSTRPPHRAPGLPGPRGWVPGQAREAQPALVDGERAGAPGAPCANALPTPALAVDSHPRAWAPASPSSWSASADSAGAHADRELHCAVLNADTHLTCSCRSLREKQAFPRVFWQWIQKREQQCRECRGGWADLKLSAQSRGGCHRSGGRVCRALPLPVRWQSSHGGHADGCIQIRLYTPRGHFSPFRSHPDPHHHPCARTRRRLAVHSGRLLDSTLEVALS